MTDEQTSTSETPPEMAEQAAPMPEPRHGSRLMQFGRKHPVLTVAGLAGAGLVGGIEMAAGVLLGAGVTALMRRRNTAGWLQGETRHEEPPHEEAHHERRQRMREMLARAPHDLQGLRERARAVVLAARGEIHAPAAQREQRPAESSEAAGLP